MKKGPLPIPGICPMGACASACPPVVPVTVIVPAYNEADTTLAADALEMLLTPFDADEADEVVAACGFVVPRTASLRFALR